MLLTFKKKLRRTFERIKLYIESIRDADRYFHAASWAGPCEHHKLSHLEAEIIRHYHVLEKSICMPDFRPKAGKDVLRGLIVILERWKSEGGNLDLTHYRAAKDVVRSYYERHKKLGIDVSDLIPAPFIKEPSDKPKIGGFKTPLEVSTEDLACFEKIALSRHSIRNFNPEHVPDRATVLDAVRIAISTPSVCNRQTWRVHFFEGAEAQQILAFQNGNRGFGHLIPLVAVVTSDMRLFSGGKERYQAWIETGMFSMNFILALHSMKIGSIALNWSRLNNDDILFRKFSLIPDHERIAMLIGCGYASKDHNVTCSPRSPLDDFVFWHNK